MNVKNYFGSCPQRALRARMLSLDLPRGNLVMRLRAWLWRLLELFVDQPFTSCVTLGEFLTYPETQNKITNVNHLVYSKWWQLLIL